jgi:hypothetical protein
MTIPRNFKLWLDWPQIQFRFFRPSSFNQHCITTGPETTFLCALCVIRPPSYLLWPRTFFLGVGLADLGGFGRYFGQNKEIVSAFYGSATFDPGTAGQRHYPELGTRSSLVAVWY